METTGPSPIRAEPPQEIRFGRGPGGLSVVSVDGSAAGRIPVAVTEPGFPDWIP